MSEEDVKVVSRSFRPLEDQAFIFATWRNSAFYGVPRGTEDDGKRFFREMTDVIREILKTALVRVACLSDDPNTLIGYSIATGTHLEWIYVKVEYRNKGIGKMLMPKNIETVTDRLTKIGSVIADKKKLKTKEKDYANGNSPKGLYDYEEEERNDPHSRENPIAH